MEILTHLFAFIGGLGTGYTVKLVISNKKNKIVADSSIQQSHNIAGGDIVGGNKSNIQK